MRKRDKVRFLGAAVFICALFVWTALCARGWSRSPAEETSRAAEKTGFLTVSGLIIRTEECVSCSGDFVEVAVAEGAKVASGGTLAVCYGSENARRRAVEEESLRVGSEALEGDAETVLADAAASMGSLRAGDVAAALQAALGAETAVNAEEEAGAAREAYEALAAENQREQTPVLSARSGWFSYETDGMERLSAADIAAKSPAELRALEEKRLSPVRGAFGKLVEENCWWFATVLPQATAATLSAATAVTLCPEGTEREYSAALFSVGAASAGECVVLFVIQGGIENVLTQRCVTAQLRLEG